MAAKPARKNSGNLLPGGVKGNKGGTGRPSNAFRTRCEHLRDMLIKGKALDAIAKDPAHPAFMPLLRFTAEYTEGKPAQPVTHAGGVEITIRKASE